MAVPPQSPRCFERLFWWLRQDAALVAPSFGSCPCGAILPARPRCRAAGSRKARFSGLPLGLPLEGHEHDGRPWCVGARGCETTIACHHIVSQPLHAARLPVRNCENPIGSLATRVAPSYRAIDRPRRRRSTAVPPGRRRSDSLGRLADDPAWLMMLGLRPRDRTRSSSRSRPLNFRAIARQSRTTACGQPWQG